MTPQAAAGAEPDRPDIPTPNPFFSKGCFYNGGDGSQGCLLMSGRVLKKFSLLGALIWAGLTLALAVFLTYFIERQMFRDTSLASLDYFQAVTATLPTEAELRRFRQEVGAARLEKALAPLLDERKTVTVKLYDGSGRLLYHSRAPEQAGKSFPRHPNLERALAGEKTFGISDLSHPENVAERRLGIGHLLEIYLPIRDSATGAVTGVYEIYTSLAPFYQRLWRQRMVVWSIVVAGALTLYVGLFVHFKRASWTILGQAREIGEKAENLEQTLAELKSAQAELLRSERLATVGKLAAGVAHEVGNPLGSIMGMADLLLRCQGRSCDKAECEEYLERINSEVMRLKGIIRALLDYARPVPARLEPLDLNAIAEKTLPLFRVQKAYRSVHVRTELADPAPRAWGDETLLQQIFLNLLLNAGQAMQGEGSLLIRTCSDPPEGRADLRVGPLRPGERGICALEVRDDGPGIAPDLLPRIFEPFVTTRGAGEGMGLGLAVCLRLVEELKGAIEVETRRGEGSSIRILLPGAGAALEKPILERLPVE